MRGTTTMRLALSICGLIVLGSNVVSPASAADAKQLAAALSAGTPAERHAAADGLADLGYAAQEAVPQLVAALGSNDPELRWRAARALGVIGDAKAAPA